MKETKQWLFREQDHGSYRKMLSLLDIVE